jgi:hypothetical protein
MRLGEVKQQMMVTFIKLFQQKQLFLRHKTVLMTVRIPFAACI